MTRSRWLGPPAALVLAAVLALPVVGAEAHDPSRPHDGLLARTAPLQVLQAAQNTCQSWPSSPPLGTLPGQPPPAWCSPLTHGDPTFVEGANSWIDEFDHGLSNATLGEGYRVFEREGSSINKALHFRHNDHWMVDVNGVDADGGGPWNFGGALMRPDRPFRFQNGTLIVEADVAAGIEEYGGGAWPELIVSMAPSPTGRIVDGLYGYGVFGGQWTVGCRLQSSRSPICAMYDTSGRGAGEGGRTFEISSHQHEGAQVLGGSYRPEMADAWHLCRGTDPDIDCRDRFRWVLSRDTLTLYVNGVKYMEHRGLPTGKQLPDAMLDGDVYVYLASWIYKTDAEVVRFHWDRLAINPDDGGSATPSARPASKPADHSAHGAAHPPAMPAADATASRVATASPRAMPDTTAVTFDDRAGQDQALEGQYPPGVIDWGSGRWYLAGPFAGFTSKSISFNGSGITSAALTFPTPRRLVQVNATNGGSGPSTVTLSCAGLPTATATVKSGQVATVETGWTETCGDVTFTSSNGWDTNFDDLVLAALGNGTEAGTLPAPAELPHAHE
jgi:hypothetical protein